MRHSGSIAAGEAWRDVDDIARACLSSCGLALHGAPRLPPPERWPLLLPTLRTLRLAPLAYWATRRLAVPLLPGVEEALKAAFYGNAARYELLRCALGKVEEAFSDHRIPCIVLKGLSLAGSVYPDPACRPMEDIDILVQPEHLHAASRVLLSLGFSDRSFGVEDFRDPSSGAVVDLHAELLNTTRLPARRGAWQPDLAAWRRRACRLPAHPHARSLHPHDHFAYVCHHAWLHHGLRKPIALLDVCLLFRAIDGQAECLLEREDFEAIRRGLWYALLACQQRFGLPVPGALERRLRPADAGRLERCIHAAAIRGRLPDAARYGYLWFALPRPERMGYLRQLRAAHRRLAAADPAGGSRPKAS